MFYGFIGTGLMGYPMAQQLLTADLPLTVYNRSQVKAQPLAQEGATVVSSALEVLQCSDCIVLMLTDTEAIRSTVLSDDTSRKSLAGRTIIQMGTIAPEESQQLAQDIEALKGAYFECPVLGSIPEAKAGTLILMVGSTPEQFDQWQAFLKHFGPTPQHIGPVGAGMALKLAMNQLIGSLTTAFALSLAYAQRHQVATEQLMDILRNSALYAPTFDKKLHRMLDRNFANPNFPSKHLAKDINLFLKSAKPLGLATESLDGVQSILEQAMAAGLVDTDYSALYSIVNPEV